MARRTDHRGVRSNTEKYYDIAIRLDGDVSDPTDRVTLSSSGKRE